MGSSSIIAIDPGEDTGWAFSHNGILTACGLAKPTKLPPVRYAKLIIECPQVYPHGTTVDPNDLIKLALKVGRAQQFYESLGCEVFQTLPRQWKGQVPKDICENRTRKALYLNESLMVEDALKKVPEGKQHNTWDALALNLWFMKVERIRP